VALSLAAVNGHVECVEALLEAAADTTMVHTHTHTHTHTRTTTLVHAYMQSSSYPPLTLLLSQVDKKLGQMPIHWALSAPKTDENPDPGPKALTIMKLLITKNNELLEVRDPEVTATHCPLSVCLCCVPSLRLPLSQTTATTTTNTTSHHTTPHYTT
jgi:hypothetical protein